MKDLGKLFIIALALVFVSASCEKEGIYNPNKKIQKIYASSSVTLNGVTTTDDKYLDEVWHWNGNILESVDKYNSDGSIRGTQTYLYDGKRLSEIIFGEHMDYRLYYDGKFLSHIDYLDDGELVHRVEFTHDGKDIIEMKSINYGGNKTDDLSRIFQIVMPQMNRQIANNLADHINLQIAENKRGGLTEKLEWDNGNLIKMTTIGLYDDPIINTFAYDNKINPYKGLFNFENSGLYRIFSKNNMLSDHDSSTGNTLTYEYTYDGKYPVSVTTTSSKESFSYTHNYYYEY